MSKNVGWQAEKCTIVCECGRANIESEYRKDKGMWYSRNVCAYCRRPELLLSKSHAHRYIAIEQKKKYGYNFCTNPVCADYGSKLTEVDVHHCDGDHDNNSRANLVALCDKCHAIETKLHSDNLKKGHNNRRVAYKKWVANGKKGAIIF